MYHKVPWMDLEPLQKEIEGEMYAKFTEVYHSQHYIQGPENRLFEKHFSEYCDSKFACGVNSGLDAIQTVLKAWNIGPGDEVIVPANTYVSGVMAPLRLGAKPVLVDVSIHDFNIDISKLEKAITPNTKAIMPTHLFGQAADMDAIMEIARRHGINVLEDASQAHGARYKGKRVGGLANAAAFSLYPGKNLGCLGDGGIIVTNEKDLSTKCHMISDYGQDYRYHHCIIGDNTALDELQAGFLNVKLPHLDRWNEYRRKVAAHYIGGIKNPKIMLPFVDDWNEPVWYVFALRCNQRDEFREYLKKHGISSDCHYPVPIHLQPAYKILGYQQGDFPVTEQISKTEVDIPIYYGITNEDVQYVIDVINEF